MLKVNILLSTFQPEKFLKEQLESLEAQNVEYQLYIRDDASQDKPNVSTREEKIAKFEFGIENIGPKNSFFELLKSESNSDFVAFCDQDDIWLSNKLESAIEKIGTTEVPTLYYSNAFLFENGEIIGTTDYHYAELPQSFFENNAMGCTMVMNRAAAELIKKYPGKFAVMHDWASLLIVKLRGKVIFDSTPTILYRKHPNQAIGYRGGRRFSKLFDLKSILASLDQMKEIYYYFPPLGNNPKEEKIWKILPLADGKERIFFLKLFFLKIQFRRKWQHEVIFRIKILCLSISPMKPIALSPEDKDFSI